MGGFKVFLNRKAQGMAEKAGNKLGKTITKNKNLDQLSEIMIKMAKMPQVGPGKIAVDLYANMPSEIREVAKDKELKTGEEIKNEYFKWERFKELWLNVLEQTEEDFVELCEKSLKEERN